MHLMGEEFLASVFDIRLMVQIGTRWEKAQLH